MKHLDTISSEVREKRQQGIQLTSSDEHTQNSVPQNKKQLIEIILINFLYSHIIIKPCQSFIYAAMYYFDTFVISKIKTQFTLHKIRWLLICDQNPNIHPYCPHD